MPWLAALNAGRFTKLVATAGRGASNRRTPSAAANAPERRRTATGMAPYLGGPALGCQPLFPIGYRAFSFTSSYGAAHG